VDYKKDCRELTSSRGAISSWATRTRRSTRWSRCWRSATTCHPAGREWTRPSIHCGRTRVSSSSWSGTRP